jgi:hypothetical protein
MVGLIRHAQIGTKDIDADLALLIPVVGQSCHGVDTSKADSGFFVSKLFGGCGVALGKLLRVGSVCVSLDESLLAVGVDTDEDSTDEPGDSDGGLNDVKWVDRGWPTVGSRRPWYGDRP